MVSSSIPRSRTVVPLSKAAALLARCHVIVALGGAAVTAQDSTDMPWVGQFLFGAIVLFLGYGAPTILLTVSIWWVASKVLRPSSFRSQFATWTGACACGAAVWLAYLPDEPKLPLIMAVAQLLAVASFRRVRPSLDRRE